MRGGGRDREGRPVRVGLVSLRREACLDPSSPWIWTQPEETGCPATLQAKGSGQKQWAEAEGQAWLWAEDKGERHRPEGIIKANV